MHPTVAPNGIQSATAVFQALIAERLAEKYRAVELLTEKRDCIDLVTLRALLIRAINEDFKVGREVELDDPLISRTRSWLLEMLGRISANDDETTALVIKHVHQDHEPYYWARYWSLEGLISGKNPKTEEVAKTAAQNSKDPIVEMLATAFLALKDSKAAQKLKENLEDPKRQWYVLRALRVVPVPVTVTRVCEIVEAGEYTDATYDAIMALGKIPSHWSQSTMAAQALSTCISKMRFSPWMDGMRTGAITGLGNLKIESSGPLIIQELTDDNPAVVREAARSIEKILGCSVTVVRVVEAASKSGAAAIDAYGLALRWLNRTAVADELDKLMLTGSARQQEVARALLAELGGAVAHEKLRARTDAMKQYTDVLEKTEHKIRELFQESVHEAQKGFHLAAVMDAVVFGLGVLLLLGSAGYALWNTGNLTNWAGVGLSAGTGVLGILYGMLIANPRQQVTKSVDHLMRLKMVFLAYLRRLHQADQAYTRRLLDDELISAKELSEFGDIVGQIMKDTIQQHLDGTDNAKSKRTRQSAKTLTEA